MHTILKDNKFSFEVFSSHLKKGNMINHMIPSASKVNAIGCL